MTILKEADDLINGERQKQYDHPSEDFAFQGRVLGAMVERYLRKHVKGMENARVPAFPGWFMGLLAANCEKASHAIADPDHRDSWVDGVGYWGAGWEARWKKYDSAMDAVRRADPVEPGGLGDQLLNAAIDNRYIPTRTQADSPGEGWTDRPEEAWKAQPMYRNHFRRMSDPVFHLDPDDVPPQSTPLFVGGRADHPDWEAAQKMTKDNTTPEDLGVAPTEGE